MNKESNKFLHNQNYIKPRNFDSKIIYLKYFYLLKKNILNSIFVILLSFIVFLIAFNFQLISWWYIYFDWNEYLYFDTAFKVFYTWLLFWFVYLLILKEINLNSINSNFNFKSYQFKRSEILYFIAIWTTIIIYFFYIDYLLILWFLKFLFIWFILISGIFLFDFLFIKKEKYFIKKPIKNYTNPFISFKNNNLYSIIKNDKSNNKKYFYKVILILYSIVVLLIFITIYYSIDKNHNKINIKSLYTINLNKFNTNWNLDLSWLHLWKNSNNLIFRYIKENKVSELDINNNNFNKLIYPVNYQYKLKSINYWDINKLNYKSYHYNKSYIKSKEIKGYKQFRDDLLNAYKISNKVILNNKWKPIVFEKTTKINKLDEKIKFIYFLTYTDYKFLNIDLYFNIENAQLEILKWLVSNWKTDTQKVRNSINEIEEKNKNTKIFLKDLLNDEELFNKSNIKKIYLTKILDWFRSNQMTRDITKWNTDINSFIFKEYPKIINEFNDFLIFIKNIKNKKLEIWFFNIDEFCIKYSWKFDCNILKNRINSIKNDNTKQVLLNNNYIISNYWNFYRFKEYSLSDNQVFLLDIYKKLQKRTKILDLLDLSNNFISPLLFNNLIWKFDNLKTLKVRNLINKNSEFIIDLKETKIKNFDIWSTNIKFLLPDKKFYKEINIFIDNKENKTCKSNSKNYTMLPNIFNNRALYLQWKWWSICSWWPKNDLEWTVWEFEFKENFLNIYSKNSLSELEINDLFRYIKINNLLYREKIDNYFIEQILETFNISDEPLKSDYKKFLYDLKSIYYYNKYKSRYFVNFSYKPTWKIPFNKIYKKDNIIIFILNDK